ncbi:MAG TPA: iron-containing alcohol dehydrogenase, partial [Spirochaetia bacterium]|nr:iron-containing alcohol dehydrogenase [Spirochaetia bacterium]
MNQTKVQTGMRILRVNMSEARVAFEPLLEDWTLIGGRGLLDKILNREVPPDCDPTGRKNKLIFAGGPLAGTNAPQLGRISVGGKSPLTLGIKESNAGGPAAQKLDRLGIRAVVVEGMTTGHKFFLLHITKDGAELISADGYVGLKNYTFYERIKERYGGKITLISIGIGGERMYKSASIALTDMLGDPSRNAGRGGLGAVMGSKGLKAIIIDDSGAPPVEIADKSSFRETVKSWIETLQKDVVCGLFSKFGTPFTIASNSYQGTMPAENYSSGRPGKFRDVTGEVIKRKVRARGGKMHGCMPGCVIKCSIIYNDAGNKRLASAYEYEAVAMLGTNLGISDPDAIGRAKYICDDLGIDFMEVGSSLGVAASGGKMKMGDASSALELLQEIEEDTDFGRILANGVVSTARNLNIKRVPAFKGQSLPGHDPRAVKGMGVTYATSPQGADHTAGLTYKQPLAKKGQIENSLRAQIRAAACDTLGYCLNSVPGGRASIYGFLAALLSARYGGEVTANDVLEIGKQTIREELAFNRGTEFGRRSDPLPEFLRTEPLYPTNQVFDVEESELATIWNRMEAYTEQEKVWEVRFPQLPSFLVGAGVVQSIGERAKRLGMCKAIIVADPVMEKLGRTAELQKILEKSGVASAVFAKVEPDPPVESIEGAAEFFKRERGDGLIALGGGSSMDTAKAIAVRATQPGL